MRTATTLPSAKHICAQRTARCNRKRALRCTTRRYCAAWSLLDHVCRVCASAIFCSSGHLGKCRCCNCQSHDFCERSPTRQVLLPIQHESIWNIPAHYLTKTKRSITSRGLPVKPKDYCCADPRPGIHIPAVADEAGKIEPFPGQARISPFCVQLMSSAAAVPRLSIGGGI